MAKLVLLNSVLDQTAGSKFDDVTEVTLIARLRSAGGVFVTDGEFAIAETAALRSVRAGAGAADAIMVAAATEAALTRGKANASSIAANAAAISLGTKTSSKARPRTKASSWSYAVKTVREAVRSTKSISSNSSYA